MKPICLYLPQYHAIKENNEWWGEGFTEWTSVKRGKPLYKGHVQPRVPLDKNYYDLLNEGVKTWSWQAKLAEKYGIYGFCIYHYWFLGAQLLEKPMEILRDNPQIPLRYSICWANETWTKTWYDKADVVLMKQEYGGRTDWEKHFSYLNTFFQDERYIKIENKPVLHIYRTTDIEQLEEMLSCFHELARKVGFDGLFIIAGNTAGALEERKQLVNGFYNFEPGYTLKHHLKPWQTLCYQSGVLLKTTWNKLFRHEVLERVIPAHWIFDSIAARGSEGKNVFPGLIPDWDNTPRRSHKGLVYRGASPKLFEQCLTSLKKNMQNKKFDFVYINAWNEWGEGAYLEPDENNGYAYLEAVKRVMS